MSGIRRFSIFNNGVDRNTLFYIPRRDREKGSLGLKIRCSHRCIGLIQNLQLFKICPYTS